MKPAFAISVAAALAVASAAGGYRWGTQHRDPPAGDDAAVGRKPLYWHDPMYPQHRFDKPGKSPFMDMQLVPVYADAAGGSAPGVTVSAGAAQNLGVRVVAAESGVLEPRRQVVGAIGWNERNVALVQPRAGGFVERVHARAPLEPVAKEAPLVELLVPEWAGAQEEFLLLERRGERELAAAARQRLLLLGMSEAQVDAVAKAGVVQSRFTLRAPIGGVIAELGVREGMTVAAGQLLYRIADLSSVWVTIEVPEAEASWLRPGARAEVRVPAYPGVAFPGRLGAVLPEVNAAARTVRARVELPNPGQRLKPGMFASIAFDGAAGRTVVLVPSEAVIRTGARNVVIVQEGTRFVPASVDVGRELDGRSEILKGLDVGARVVASGQFLIDSEASLRGALDRLGPATADPGAARPHAGRARVLSVDPSAGRVELDHDPMPTLRWPAMRMGFRAADPAALRGLGIGDVVEFEVRGEPDKDGDYVIDAIRRRSAR